MNYPENTELFRRTLADGARHYGIALSDQSISLFSQYTSLLRQRNASTNLISSRDLDRFCEYHLLDSLKLAGSLDIGSLRRILDFGSGAGLPGIPLAIAFPHAAVYLVDSRKIRCIFLNDVVEYLSLTNVTVLCGRIETVDHSLDGSFDMVVTRGTVSLSSFLHCASRFVSSGGSLVSIKGEKIDEEYDALLHDTDSTVFNILRTYPVPYSGVRNGWLVNISKR
jgi:16S rRNA (guanine527-N7)-methyltransferase